MNDDIKGGFRGTITGLLIGLMFMLTTLTSGGDPWPYFWALLAVTSVVILLRLALAVYYVGVRKGESATSDLTKGDQEK